MKFIWKQKKVFSLHPLLAGGIEILFLSLLFLVNINPVFAVENFVCPGGCQADIAKCANGASQVPTESCSGGQFCCAVSNNNNPPPSEGNGGKGYTFLAPLPVNPSKTLTNFSDYAQYLYITLVGLAIVFAVFMIVIGGIKYVGAQTLFEKDGGKKYIQDAVIGLALVLASYLILQTLNPKLLTVGLDLQEVKILAPNGVSGSDLPGYVAPTGGGGALNCKTGKCASNATISNAVKNNSAGVNPNIMMSMIDGGEGCNSKSSPVGACGYSQVMPQYRRTVCGLTGSDSQTCSAMQNDINIDINCGAKFLGSDFIPRCGPSITAIASCYNTGKKTNCGQQNYCQRVTDYYNTCTP